MPASVQGPQDHGGDWTAKLRAALAVLGTVDGSHVATCLDEAAAEGGPVGVVS
ncbi:hypothetical protein ACQEU8_35935 [Streptomyces sp. CA-250714]|uniref:hypothetical protein n=1 Tax=Streptomyces sp. CA-250714 TaxID=3240060 RepID=UPI003D90FB34